MLFLYMVIKIWNDIQKEMEGLMLNTFSLVKPKSLHIELYLNMYKHPKISCCYNSFKNYFILIATLLDWSLIFFSFQIGH